MSEQGACLALNLTNDMCRLFTVQLDSVRVRASPGLECHPQHKDPAEASAGMPATQALRSKQIADSRYHSSNKDIKRVRIFGLGFCSACAHLHMHVHGTRRFVQ